MARFAPRKRVVPHIAPVSARIVAGLKLMARLLLAPFRRASSPG
jgi:hypothetical protein